MSDIEKIKKYISPNVPITVKDDEGNEDTIEMKPLSMAQQGRAFELSKKFKKLQDKDGEIDSDKLDSETIEDSVDLILGIVKRTYPDLDDETAEEFVNTNFMDLFSQIEKLIPKSTEVKNQELIQKRKEMVKNAKKQ